MFWMPKPIAMKTSSVIFIPNSRAFTAGVLESLITKVLGLNN